MPHNLDAEQALLGAVFMDPEALHSLSQLVRPEMFYRASHTVIFTAMQSVSKTGDVDWLRVQEAITAAGQLEKCGGAETLKAYLNEVTCAIPSAYGAIGYAEIIRDRWVKREAIYAAQELAVTLHADNAKASDEIAKAARKLVDLTSAYTTSDPRNVADFVAEAQEASKAGGLGGLMSPWESLNKITTGWKPGQLIVVAAGTGVGKSAFAAAIAGHNLSAGVLLFSLEMMGREVASRMICMDAGIDSRRYDLGTLTPQDRARADEAAARLAGNYWIDDTASMDVNALRSKALRWRAKHEISMVIVDYLGLVDERMDGANRTAVVGAISRGLKMLAMECKIPVLALHQLNRDSAKEKREPQLHDLRDSGNVEQDANQVILLHRESSNEETGIDAIKVRVAKNRGGPLSHVTLNFRRKCTRFEAQVVEPYTATTPNFQPVDDRAGKD